VDQSTLQSVIEFAKLIHLVVWVIGMAAVLLAVMVFVYAMLTEKITDRSI
jgi:hypothetical protein